MFGNRVTLPGGHVPLAHGAETLIERLKRPLPAGSVRLNHEVTHIDWSLLSRDPRCLFHQPIFVTTSRKKARQFFSCESLSKTV